PVQDAPMELAGVETGPASEPAPVYAEAAPAVAPAPSGAIVAPLLTAREIVQPLPASYRRKAVRKLRPEMVAKRQMIVEREKVQVASAPAPKAAPAPAKPAIAPAVFQKASFSPVSGGAFAVQLGVFSSTANANRAWAGYSAKHKDLAAFSKVAVPVTVGGRALHRLTANGFADEKSARAMCAQVRSGGGECIIARAVPTKPAGTQIAARR
ncbi:SPOR domain-containing protein, partial [Blastomonas sp. UPD001]|uniref:SPOR domain-containing protein n=1 Tax=Blastomonas sp. UPD001 TaxID=2217673 RepID=UPI001E3253D4